MGRLTNLRRALHPASDSRRSGKRPGIAVHTCLILVDACDQDAPAELTGPLSIALADRQTSTPVRLVTGTSEPQQEAVQRWLRQPPQAFQDHPLVHEISIALDRLPDLGPNELPFVQVGKVHVVCVDARMAQRILGQIMHGPTRRGFRGAVLLRRSSADARSTRWGVVSL